MAKHVALPSKKAQTKTTDTPPVPVNSPEHFLADRVTRVAENGHFVYLVRAKLQGSTLSGMFFLTHTKLFEQRAFDAMLKEAVAVVNEIRIPTRRRDMADQKIGIEDPVKTNETLFEGDADALEIVMMDKFGFRKLFYSPGEAEIIPTVVNTGR